MSELSNLIKSGNAISNPLGAGSKLINNKVDAARAKVTGLVDDKSAELLKKVGIGKNEMNKIKSVINKADKLSSLASNYGKESANDFFRKCSAAQTFMANNPAVGCVAGELFGVASGVGKEILSAVSGKLAGLNGMLGKFDQLVEFAKMGEEFIQASLDSIQRLYGEAMSAINDMASFVENQYTALVGAIETEIRRFEDIVSDNISHAVSALIPGLMKNDCLAGAIKSSATGALSRLI